MNNGKSFYVGNGKALIVKGKVLFKFKVDKQFLNPSSFDQNELREATSSWQTRDGELVEEVNFIAWPLKDDNQNSFKTHSVKLDTNWDWRKEEEAKTSSKFEEPKILENSDLPF